MTAEITFGEAYEILNVLYSPVLDSGIAHHTGCVIGGAPREQAQVARGKAEGE